MGHRRGYDCDICGTSSESAKHFIGLSLECGCSEFVVDSADYHVCLRCARVITNALHHRKPIEGEQDAK